MIYILEGWCDILELTVSFHCKLDNCCSGNSQISHHVRASPNITTPLMQLLSQQYCDQPAELFFLLGCLVIFSMMDALPQMLAGDRMIFTFPLYKFYPQNTFPGFTVSFSTLSPSMPLTSHLVHKFIQSHLRPHIFIKSGL